MGSHAEIISVSGNIEILSEGKAKLIGICVGKTVNVMGTFASTDCFVFSQ